jgi:hypothetical protein
MRNDAVDRVPYFEEPLRKEVLEAWYAQGLAPDVDPGRIFHTDRHELIEPDLAPIPEPAAWPESSADMLRFGQHLKPDDQPRFPGDWTDQIRRLRSRDYPVMLRVHRGLFLTMGVHGWRRFEKAIHLIGDDPDAAHGMMNMQGEFAAAVAEKVMRDVEVDAAIFSEPISDTHGPLISPRMYEELVLRSYEPLLDALRQYGVETIIFMTYANSKLLLPCVLERGFNCLWAYEVNAEAMDYRLLRREFGRDLRLIGGIDLDAIRAGKDEIRREILEKVPPLLAEGGYLPGADGRIREDVPYENYAYYRQLLEEVTGK